MSAFEDLIMLEEPCRDCGGHGAIPRLPVFHRDDGHGGHWDAGLDDCATCTGTGRLLTQHGHALKAFIKRHGITGPVGPPGPMGVSGR